MRDVSQDGRTVLFVSHNMGLILHLCSQSVVMAQGRNSPLLPSGDAVRNYLGSASEAAQLPFGESQSHSYKYLRELRVLSESGADSSFVGDGIRISLRLCGSAESPVRECGIVFNSSQGHRAVSFHTRWHGAPQFAASKPLDLVCDIPELPLVPDNYTIDVMLGDGTSVLERCDGVARLEVLFRDVLGTGQLPRPQHGPLVTRCEWKIDPTQIQSDEAGEKPEELPVLVNGG